MRRTLRSHTGESLDMLLDTITNMFGGIIFIAILVALMTGRQTVHKAEQVDAAADRVVTLRTDIEEGRSRSDRKTDLATFLQGLIRRPDTSWDVTLTQLATDMKAAALRLDRAERQLAQLQDKRAPIDQKLQLASEQAGRQRMAIAQLEIAIQREKELRSVEARLPVTRITNKRPAHIVLARGRMFIVDGCRGGLDALVDRAARDIELVPRPQDCTEIVLLPNAGLRIDGHLERSSRWERLLQVATRDRYFLYLVVFSDTYEEFLLLRQLAVSAGYDYDVVPLSADDPLVMSPASQFTTQ